MPFGKYRDRELVDIPDDYLDWLLTLADLAPRLRKHIERELEARDQEYDGTHEGYDGQTPYGTQLPDLSSTESVITKWHRELCLLWHPDRGGDQKVMAAINDAVDRLRKMIEQHIRKEN
jgi:hypothetical protein